MLLGRKQGPKRRWNCINEDGKKKKKRRKETQIT